MIRGVAERLDLAAERIAFGDVYVAGRWVPSESARVLPLTDPSSEQVFATFPNGGSGDVERAVAAARAAFQEWSATPVEQRVAVLERARAGLEARTEELVRSFAREIGSPLWFGRQVQLGLPLANFALALQAMRDMALEEVIANSLVVKEPIGVVAAITPWNAPLHQIVAKVAAALAAGCTVVLKPSEVAPLSAVVMAEVLEEAGLPAGAFNLVFGDGVSAGEPLVAHPDVDMVSFTGSVRGGQRVAELAGRGVKKVALELGGKSATILLDDAPMALAASVVLAQCFANTGQVCSAQTRLLVPRARLTEVEALLVESTAAWTTGHPLDPDTRLGPLVSQAQWSRVQGYVESGVREGARLLLGGPGRPEGLERGYYVRPTIFSDVTREMTIACEEIFGPVLSVMPYDTVDEAVQVANGVPYGLSGGVWSEDRGRALELARRLRTGQVIVNGSPRNLAAPFGGCKLSGVGRENGRFGVEEFFELKAIQGGA
jgi:acyl-CoA reductase-like NAD-dependent aldehyde dehydrogenase